MSKIKDGDSPLPLLPVATVRLEIPEATVESRVRLEREESRDLPMHWRDTTEFTTTMARKSCWLLRGKGNHNSAVCYHSMNFIEPYDLDLMLWSSSIVLLLLHIGSDFTQLATDLLKGLLVYGFNVMLVNHPRVVDAGLSRTKLIKKNSMKWMMILRYFDGRRRSFFFFSYP